MIECVQPFAYGHNQVLWERVDKSRSVGFVRRATVRGAHSKLPLERWLTVRWLSFYPEAEQPGGAGCLHGNLLWPEEIISREFAPAPAPCIDQTLIGDRG